MGEIRESEQEVLLEFKRQLSDLNLENDEILSDIQLIRWLRARDMDIPKSEQMLRNHLAMRQEQDLENLMKETVPEYLQAQYPLEVVGPDKQGNPVVYIPYGKMNMQRAFKTVGKEYAYKMRNYYVEKMFREALKLTPPGSKVMKRFTMMVDFQGLSYMQFASVEVLEYVLSTLQVLEQHYPEMLGTFLAINNPAVWSVLYTMTKPFVNAKTLEKVVIVGSDSNKILEILEGYIETKYIPTRYGGLAKVKYEQPTILTDENANDGSENTNQRNSSFLRGMFRGFS